MTWTLRFAIVLLSASPAIAEEPPPRVKIQKNIVYTTIDGLALRVDMASPIGRKGPRPACVCIHGGAWRGGHRSDLSLPNTLFYNRSLIEMLAEEGYVAISVSYRLAPRAQFPAQILDCKTAVRWLRANATKYNVDPNRIGGVGFSAGGHLTCLMGTCDKNDGFDTTEFGEVSSELQAAVNFFPPTDISMYGNIPLEESLLKPWLGALFRDKPEVFKRASPIEYCKKSCCPMLFIHGTEDILVPIEHSRKMVAKLKELGVRTELMELEGESHGWVGDPVKKSNEKMLRFLAEHLKP